jgi:NitT/TauT family transport system substrate-binding protein
MAVLLTGALAAPAHAETDRLRIGLQYGLPYMQPVLMQDQDLIGARARTAGLPNLHTEFVTVGGPSVLNDGLISGEISIGAVGMSNLVTMWDKTRGQGAVRGLCGMNVMPLLLVTSDPHIHSIADYGARDRIAVPSVKVSMQAMMLDILAAKAFGESEYRRLDPNTVSMGHPDATAGLLAGGAAFTSHFSSPPYQYIEVARPGIHAIASSFDAIGPHSVSALAATTRFRTENPTVVGVFLDAMRDATRFIRQHPREAAEVYLRVTHDKMSADELVAMMHEPGVLFTLAPHGAQETADFMAKVGLIKHRPASWHDMYFDTAPTSDD